MKKKLLFIVPILLFVVTASAQIKYWDFGAKELGASYENMLPEAYLNAFANYNREITYTDHEGVNHAADPVDENGTTYETLYNSFVAPSKYTDPDGHFQLTSKGSSATPPGGTLLSGGSEWTKPKFLDDIDGNIDFVFQRHSNSDQLLTVNTNITRYDERTTMPDGMDANAFPGCIRYSTPGAKLRSHNGDRGFLLNMEANQWVTVVGSGEYTDIEGDGSLGWSTGYFTFETFGGTGEVVSIEDKGEGTGSPDNSGDTGDEDVRVMQFQAKDAGTYRIGYDGGRVKFYRVYLGQVDVSLGAGLQTDIYINGVYTKTLSLDKNKRVSTNLKAVGNRVYVSNVRSNTEINIYSITGALVKSLKTDVDTNFEFNSGLFIATIKTAEGQKSVKFVTK